MSDEFLFEKATRGRTAAVPHEYAHASDSEYRWQSAVSFNLGPLVVNGVVYVLTEDDAEDDGYDNTIIGYDLQTGRGTCRVAVPDSCHCQEMVSDGRLLYIYTEQAVTAIDPQAERTRWTREFADNPDYAVGSLITTDDTVYATAISENMMGNAYDANIWNMSIVQMDTSDGTGGVQRFKEVQQETRPNAVAETWLAYADGLLFFGLDNHLYAVDPTQGPEYEWKQPIPGFDSAFHCRVDRQGIAAGMSGVYLAPSRVDAGKESVTGDTRPGGERLQASVAAYDHYTGTVQWETPLSKSGVAALATADDIVVAYEHSDSLIALDARDGSRQWEYHDAACQPTIAGTTVYTTHSPTGDVVGIDIATGEETHRYEITEGFGAVCPLSNAVVTTGDGTLACVEIEGSGDTGSVSEGAATHAAGTSSTQQDSEIKAETDCPNCGEAVTLDMQFCSACGTELDDSQACPSCGEALTGDEAFCPACGTELSSGTQCPSCDADLEGDEAFCPSCGTAVQDM